MSVDFTLAELEAAAAIVHRCFPGTPQYAWPLLAERLGTTLWVKHENHTPTGAFKVRGGIVYAEAARRERPNVRGLISATRGNHGQSLAYAGSRFGLPVTIVMPRGNSREKNEAMRAFGGQLVEHGDDFEASVVEAARIATTEGLEFVPSFHRDLVRGVSTYALELFRAVPELDVLYVPIGLGSGICGAIRCRDLLGLRTEIVGVQATGADSYARSLAAGHPVTMPRAETRADGMATRKPDADAFAYMARGVARIVTVTDEEIAAAIRAYWTDTHNISEGAGAASLAAALQERSRLAGKRAAAILSGGNIDLELFRRWVVA